MPRLRALAVAFAALSILAACATIRCPAEGGRPWQEVETEHFRIMTDLGEEEAETTARRFERVRHVLLEVLPLEPPGRLPVVVLSGKEVFDFDDSRRSYFSPARPARIVVVSNGPKRNAAIERGQSFAHEYSHYLAAALFHRPPLWLNEGLAMFFGEILFDTDGGSATLGREDVDALEYLRRQQCLLSLESLWDWDREERSDAAEYRRYASSWFWVSYLMRMEGARFKEFLRRCSEREDARQAWEAVFPEPMQALQSRVTSNYRQWFIEWPRRTYSIPADCGSTASSRALEPAEYHVLLSQLVMRWRSKLSEQERRERRDAELKRALQHDPASLRKLELE
ncbi:MAG: DUF1570 domain-containing protein [Deltaproteobacteria bacterium]|nr:DUF1570 domain-containing protein [Deltaproteobacteria bacterium]